MNDTGGLSADMLVKLDQSKLSPAIHRSRAAPTLSG